MKYMGSKTRIAKYILPIILKDRKPGQWYVEPFAGGANMIDKVEGNRIGADINCYVINALKLIRDNLNKIPQNNKEFIEEDYLKIKKDKNNPLYSYVGFVLSYGGKWWGGWRRDSEGKRDYVKEAYNNAKKQSENLKACNLLCLPYEKLEIPKNSTIYCDPPYKKTTGYGTCNNNFGYDEFYKWCYEKKREGHQIFISEYQMPDNFVCVWQKEIVSSLTKDTGSKKAIEKLFTL
jgi:DNA adenine methylase